MALIVVKEKQNRTHNLNIYTDTLSYTWNNNLNMVRNVSRTLRMADAGFFRGTSADQDNRFSDKEKKLLKQMRFEEILATKIDLTKVKLDVLKPWITKKIAALLGMEDDVVVEFIFNQLEIKNPDPRKKCKSI
ncbi:SRRM1 [Lepeophtheirus salmonis]|uniref:SRRM1 n=1 Tax=Lepeophtheirus salmonis TaxID=72036 RepID=A0A7R8CTE6_LEPSM|nr:SRRM1 [Lepeophtheirus salmonis]CAF2873109.1 SRRM1 [Lepeophtheirus salmonis]